MGLDTLSTDAFPVPCSNVVDFDDLLSLMVALLRHGDVAERFRRRYRWLLVDEFQDTNAPQYELVRLIGLPQVIDRDIDVGLHVINRLSYVWLLHKCWKRAWDQAPLGTPDAWAFQQQVRRPDVSSAGCAGTRVCSGRPGSGDLPVAGGRLLQDVTLLPSRLSRWTPAQAWHLVRMLPSHPLPLETRSHGIHVMGLGSLLCGTLRHLRIVCVQAATV